MPVAISISLVEKHTIHKVLKEAVQGLYEAGFAYSKVDERTGKLGHYKEPMGG